MQKKINNPRVFSGTIAYFHYNLFNGKIEISLKENKRKFEICGIKKIRILRNSHCCLENEQKIIITVNEMSKSKFIHRKESKGYNVEIEIKDCFLIRIKAKSILVNENENIKL
ncbi:hypothetical protein [Anaerostipes sp.]|uniref:hypothetical protein n=1 Tax=Anaerostipes sp. TaxID=1872530 RepID=UPI0025BC2BDB|nr:hypothetical protein [Anaerostipes sp.]MBS7006938.1 hypothetical protein [Anaerostipes sp.]